MAFQIWHLDKPTYLKTVLPLFQAGTSFTNKELTKITPSVGLNVSPKHIQHLTQSWYILGILNRSKDKNEYRYKLSEFGKAILNALQFSPTLAIDFLHWAWYSAWSRLPDFEWGWSWTYQEVCHTLWINSPSQIVTKKLTAYILEKAISSFPEESPAFDDRSIQSVMTWLVAMEPPFLVASDEAKANSPRVSQKRESCSPELIFLAIQLQYHLKGLPFGTPLLIDEGIIEAACKVCLLASEQFWPMVELCSLTFTSLVRKETAYGTSLMIIEPAPFTPPAPRSVKSTSSEEDE